MLPDKFLYTYSCKDIDYTWLAEGHFLLSLDELMRSKSDKGDIQSYKCYGQSSYLYIGYAVNQTFELNYPVFYNLRDGKVYLGYLNPPTCTMARRYFRNSLDTAIHYRIKLDAIPDRKALSKKDQRISLGTLEAIKINKKLPCKILAWIIHGSSNIIFYNTGHCAPLPRDATLLVACGNQIVLTNPVEIERLSDKGVIELLLDYNNNNMPVVELVYIGNTGNDPRRISYIQNKGIACNYTGLNYLYLDGTFDATPNVAYGTESVYNTCFVSEDRGTMPNLPCYTDLDLRDSKIANDNALWNNRWLFCYSLERLICPRQHEILPIMNEYPAMQKFRFLQELELPERLTKGSYMHYCPGLKKLTCPFTVITDLYGKASFFEVFPTIATINNQEAEAYLLDLSASRLLCGLPIVNIGERKAER